MSPEFAKLWLWSVFTPLVAFILFACYKEPRVLLAVGAFVGLFVFIAITVEAQLALEKASEKKEKEKAKLSPVIPCDFYKVEHKETYPKE